VKAFINKALMKLLRYLKMKPSSSQKIKSKTISYKEEGSSHRVILECQDYLQTGEVSYMKYEEELIISKENENFYISKLTCKFKQFKKS